MQGAQLSEDRPQESQAFSLGEDFQIIHQQFRDTPGEDAEWAYQMNQAITKGFQGDELGNDSALLCPKHFPGIGCTGGGHDGHQTFLGHPKPPEGVTPGTPLKSTAETIKWHWMPFKGAIDAGTWAVMSPYYVFPEFIEKKRDRIRLVLEEWLRGELGFKGVICADWGAVTAANSSSCFTGSSNRRDASSASSWVVASSKMRVKISL